MRILASRAGALLFALVQVMTWTLATPAQAVVLAPTATVSLAPQIVLRGEATTVIVTLTNLNATPLSALTDAPTMPAGVTPQGVASNTCGGSVAINAISGGAATLSGGALTANASCSFAFIAAAATAGTYFIPTGSPSASGTAAGVAGTPTLLTVNEPLGPTTSIVLSQPSIYAGGETIMTATVANPNNVPLPGVYNTVFTAPGTSFVISLGTSSCTNGGSPSVQSVTTKSYTGNFDMTAHSSCSFTGRLTSSLPGTYLIYPGTAFATGSAPGTPGPAATLTVKSLLPPTATVSLSPSSIASGDVSLATVTLTNPNSVSLTGVGDSVDAPLHTSFIVATPGGTCNGTSTPTSSSFTLASATLAANASCTFSYQVTSNTLGSHLISPGLSSASGAVGGAFGAPAYLVVGINQSVAFQSSAPLLNTVGGTYTPVATASSGLPVTISVDATSSAVCAIASGVVTFSAPGSCVLNANQAGNGTFNAATQVQQSLTVGMASTTTTITTHTPNPSVVGTPIVVSVSVGVVAPGGGSPTGNVTVSDGSSNCFFSLPATSCNLTPSSTGSKTLTASYTGNANYIASSSGGVGHTVTLPPGSVTLFTSSNPSLFGSPVTFTAVITGNTPLGTVNFKNEGVSISGCSAQAVTSGQASCVTNTLSLGNHNITADYSGDGQYPPSTTGGFVQKVIANIVPMLMLLLD
jgi:hypothetical protein